jgi:molybdopterin converting factor small subunit
MITVHLPSILRRPGTSTELDIAEPVATIGDLVAALDRASPGLAAALDDAIYNFAVNDVLVLHGARHHRLADGDRVEIVPTISGGGTFWASEPGT